MIELSYSAQAERDIIDITYYISQRNQVAAEKIAVEIFSACDKLRNFPLIGQSRDDIAFGARHLVVGNYLVLYKVDGRIVHINRVVHGARYLPEIL